MFSIFRRQVDWDWDPDSGTPPVKVLQAQCKALKKAKPAIRLSVLNLIARSAKYDDGEPDASFQEAALANKVLDEGVTCMADNTLGQQVQEAACNALAALCTANTAASTKLLSDSTATSALLAYITGSTATKLPVESSLPLAHAAIALLRTLSTVAPGKAVSTLRPPGGMLSDILQTLLAASRTINAPSTSSTSADKYEKFLYDLLECVGACAAHGDLGLCRELAKSAWIGALVRVVQEQQGSTACNPREPALSLLTLLMEQVRSARTLLADLPNPQPLQMLQGLVRDSKLSWPIKQHVFHTLAAAAESRTVCDKLVGQGGVDDLMRLSDSLLKEVVSAQSSAQASALSSSPAAGVQGAAAISPLRRMLTFGYGTSAAAAAAAAGSVGTTPPVRAADSMGAAVQSTPGGSHQRGAYAALEDVLGVLAAVAVHQVHQPSIAAHAGLLQRMLAIGMSDFANGGHRLVQAVAQVLWRLCVRVDVSRSVFRPELHALLAGLVARGSDYSACRTTKEAQVVAGAWCAAGVLSKLYKGQLESSAPAMDAAGRELHSACMLLTSTAGPVAKALGSAVSCGPPASPDAPDNTGALLYLQAEATAAILTPSITAVLDLLATLLTITTSTSGSFHLSTTTTGGAAIISSDIAPGSSGPPAKQPNPASSAPLLSIGKRKAGADSPAQAGTSAAAALASPAAATASPFATASSSLSAAALGQLQGAIRQHREALLPALRALAGVSALCWPAKRLLRALGDEDVEFRRFVHYSAALMAQLLKQQGVDPAPFLAKGVSASDLVQLRESALVNTFGLDELQIIRVQRIQDGYSLFNQLDGLDGHVSGCLTAHDLQRYLTEKKGLGADTVSSLVQSVFADAQVPVDQPLSFMSFMHAYPALAEELAGLSGRAMQRQRLIGSDE